MAVKLSGTRKPRYVLIIEDNVHHAEILTELLDRHFAPVIIHTVDSVSDGLEFAAQSAYELILTGAVVRDEHIKESLPRLIKLASGTPVIVISGRGDEMLAAELIKLGASDYLVKTRETLEMLPGVFKRHLSSKAGKRKKTSPKGAHKSDKHHAPSPQTILREVDRLTQQALAVVGVRKRRGRQQGSAEVDRLLAQIQRLREMTAKLTD